MSTKTKNSPTMNEDILQLVKGFIDYFEEVESDITKTEEDEA